jgi:CheY-like chemotaxis protein
MEENGSLKNNKTIVLTATALSNEQVNELVNKGVTSCLTKPVDLDLLLSKIIS